MTEAKSQCKNCSSNVVHLCHHCGAITDYGDEPAQPKVYLTGGPSTPHGSLNSDIYMSDAEEFVEVPCETLRGLIVQGDDAQQAATSSEQALDVPEAPLATHGDGDPQTSPVSAQLWRTPGSTYRNVFDESSSECSTQPLTPQSPPEWSEANLPKAPSRIYLAWPGLATLNSEVISTKEWLVSPGIQMELNRAQLFNSLDAAKQEFRHIFQLLSEGKQQVIEELIKIHELRTEKATQA